MSPEFTRRCRAAALVVAVGALLVAPSAEGAFSIGPGELPGLGVDASGTAYIAWNGSESSLQFCRLPRGATACDRRHGITAAGATIRRPFVTVSGARVVVVQYRYPVRSGEPAAGLFRFTSTDGGATFGAGVRVGTVDFNDAVVGPGDTMSGVTESSNQGGAFQNVPLAGTAGNTEAYAQLWGGDRPYGGTVGLIDATTPLAIFASGSGAAQFRRYGGSGSLNDATNWTPAADIGTVSYPHLASGPSGLFLLTTNEDNTLVSRKWDGTTFGAAIPISAGANAPSMHSFQDAGARLHVVFQRGGPQGRHLIHAVSDDGTTWRSGTVVATAVAVDSFGDTRVATAADHIGVVAWKGVAADAAGPDVRVAAVGPDAPADTGAPPAAAPPPPGARPAAPPPPQVGRTANIEPVRGSVRVNTPGPGGFVALKTLDSIPIGSEVDTKRGVAKLTTAADSKGTQRSSNFSQGRFVIAQRRTGDTTAELKLSGGSFKGCPASGSSGKASAARSRRSSVRKLFGNGRAGFRTRGRNSAATVRGTAWTTDDRCDGTLTRVQRGVVSVRDLVLRRTVRVRARQSYLALTRAERRAKGGR